MFYNIGLFLRYIFMLLVGARGAWLTLEGYSIHRRWQANSTNWTTHEPKDKTFEKSGYWFSRSELLLKKHMNSNFRTFREEEPKG